MDRSITCSRMSEVTEDQSFRIAGRYPIIPETIGPVSTKDWMEKHINARLLIRFLFRMVAKYGLPPYVVSIRYKIFSMDDCHRLKQGPSNFSDEMPMFPIHFLQSMPKSSRSADNQFSPDSTFYHYDDLNIKRLSHHSFSPKMSGYKTVHRDWQRTI